MARSCWKSIPINRIYWTLAIQIKTLGYLHYLKENNLYDIQYLNSKIRLVRKNFKRLIHERTIVITPTLINTVLYIYKGNKYRRIRINDFMLGWKLGEFSFTRKPFKYPIKKKKKIFYEDNLGQISYPILNRFGYSMFWFGMWDSLLNYNKFLVRSFFLNSFFSSFFNLFFSLTFFFLSKYFNKNKITARTNFLKRFNKINLAEKSHFRTVAEKNPNNVYLGKLAILSFNEWYIVSMFAYYSKYKNPAEGLDQISSNIANYTNILFFLKNKNIELQTLKKFKFDYF